MDARSLRGDDRHQDRQLFGPVGERDTGLGQVDGSVAVVAMREQFGWTQTGKGLVLSAFFVGYMLFMVPSGWLATRYGGKRVLAASVAWWSAFTMLTPWAATFSVAALIAARIGLGVG